MISNRAGEGKRKELMQCIGSREFYNLLKETELDKLTAVSPMACIDSLLELKEQGSASRMDLEDNV